MLLTITDQMPQPTRPPRWITAHGAATAAARIASAAARDLDLRHRLRPHRENRTAELSLTGPAGIALVSTSRQMTSRQEPATKPPGCEAVNP